MLSGEHRRERVITPEEESRYLGAAPVLVGQIAAVLVDTGLRPDECFRLRWENLTWVNGRNGTLLVTHGKTLGDHFKSGQRLSVQNRPTEVARPGLSCSTPPAPVEASRFWCASSADHT